MRVETKMGKWLYRDQDNHRCEKPPGAFSVKAGDIWQCSCGKMWKVISCQNKGDQRDSWWDVQVTEFNGPVPRQKQPGNSDVGVTAWRDR